MASKQKTALLGLAFTRYDMSENDSLGWAFADSQPKCGIYVLEFANDERYVGQTVSMPDRFAAHRRKHSDIVAVSFAPCELELLDDCERLVIHHQEQEFNLRNITLTNWPGGKDDVSVTFGDGTSSLLPWDRDRRVTVSGTARSSAIARYWRLRERPDYDLLLQLLGRFVARALPDPVTTERVLWTITALPGTSRWAGHYRLCTLNAGNLEVLVAAMARADDGVWQPEIYVNLWDDERIDALGALELEHGENLWLEEVSYNMPIPIVHLVSDSFEAVLEALDHNEVLDAAYQLTTHLMRGGGRMFAKAHNRHLASDVLFAAHRADA